MLDFTPFLGDISLTVKGGAMTKQAETLELGSGGVKLSYRLLLTDIAVGIVALLLIIRHVPAFQKVDLTQTTTALLLGIMSSPVGIIVSTLSMIMLSLPIYLIECFVFVTASRHWLLSYLLAAPAQRLFSLSQVAATKGVSLSSYFELTASAEARMVESRPALHVYYYHLEGIAIFLRNIVAVLVTYLLTSWIYKFDTIVPKNVILFLSLVLAFAMIQVVVMARAYLLRYDQAAIKP